MRLARAALLRHTLYAWSFWATLHLDWANFLGRPQALDPIPEDSYSEAEDWELVDSGAVALPSGGAKIFPSSGANALVALPPEIAEALETFQRQRGVDPAGQEGEGEQWELAVAHLLSSECLNAVYARLAQQAVPPAVSAGGEGRDALSPKREPVVPAGGKGRDAPSYDYVSDEEEDRKLNLPDHPQIATPPPSSAAAAALRIHHQVLWMR